MRVKYLRVKDGERLHIEAYPNFYANGSVKGMKEQVYGKDALLVRCGSFIYNVGINEYGRHIYYNRAY